MIQFLNRPVKSFNLEITNRCVLKCPGCARTNNSEILTNLSDLSLESIQQIFAHSDPDFFKGMKIDLCGVFGDSIYHPQFLEVIAFLKTKQFLLNVETNGSYKKTQWWLALGALLSHGDTVTFSIDGLEDTNPIYRINSNWNDIMNGIQTLKGQTQLIWKFIIFKHNQHQIDEARKRADSLGMTQFVLKKSGRFVADDPFRPDSEENVGVETYTKKALSDNESNHIIVTPRCLNGKNIGITYDGHLYPCCTSSTKTQGWFEQNKEFRNLKSHSLSTILLNPKWNELEQIWKDQKDIPAICQEYCGIYQPKFSTKDSSIFKNRDRVVETFPNE
jgi:MoaA/NifB/PqqE/SkfB family radical SAM enzyme